jgi:outer membrane protein
MKNQFRSVIAALAVAAVAVGVQAKPALEVVTVDMDQLFTKYYKTETQQAKMADDEKKATEIRDGMVKEREAMVTKAKELQEQAKSKLINEEARQKAEAEFEKQVGVVRAKEGELQTFVQQTQQQLRAIWSQFQQQAFEEIAKVASDIAKKKGATLVLNQGASASSVVVFADAGFSITEDVLVAINKDRPAPAISVTTPAATAPVVTPAAKK